MLPYHSGQIVPQMLYAGGGGGGGGGGGQIWTVWWLFLYITAVILPSTIINCDLTPGAATSPDHNGATPNLSRSSTKTPAMRFPVRRYSRGRPSGRKRVFVERTRLHCLIRNWL